MSRVRACLTVTLTTVVATATLGVALAPAASANPGRETLLPAGVSSTNAKAPDVVCDVPPFGRKLV